MGTIIHDMFYLLNDLYDELGQLIDDLECEEGEYNFDNLKKLRNELKSYHGKIIEIKEKLGK